MMPGYGGPPVEDGAALLDDVAAVLTRYVAFPAPSAMVAMVLWTAHTHAIGAFSTTPRAVLTSPEKRCGKSRLVEVSAELVARPLFTANVTPAVVFRSVGGDGDELPATLLVDEADSIFNRGRGGDPGAEELRGLLNAGWRRGVVVARCVPPTMAVRRFPVFAPVLVSGIGSMPDTITDRGFVVHMRRRAPGESVAPFRYSPGTLDELHELRDRLAAWTAASADRLATLRPVLPDGVTDRAADCWEVLLAVAEAAGGQWPELARQACVAMVTDAAEAEAEHSHGVRLLGDIRAAFDGQEKMASAALLATLRAVPDAPWDEWALGPRRLAQLLRPFGVWPYKVKVGKSLQGYKREAFTEAWARYLPPPDRKPDPDPESESESAPATSAEHPEHPEPCRSAATAAVPDSSAVPEPGGKVEPAAPPPTCTVPLVPEVPDLWSGAEADGPDSGDSPAAVPSQADSPNATPTVCRTCGLPLDPAAAAGGFDRHPGCETGVPLPAVVDLSTLDAADLGTCGVCGGLTDGGQPLCQRCQAVARLDVPRCPTCRAELLASGACPWCTTTADAAKGGPAR